MRLLQPGLVLLVVLAAAPAWAGTLDRVTASGVLHCGAAARAGVAEAAEDGHVSGLAVDLCRALTIAVLGPAGRTEFRLYDSALEYQSVGRGEDEVSFLTADTVQAHDLAASVIPGPTVFVAELSTMAQPDVSSLAGRTVCFINGSPAHRALEAWAARTGAAISRSGYQEDGEMHDAFDARRCDAMAGEATELADIRAESPTRAGARILPPLALAPVFAATPVADGAWAALAGWTLDAVVQSESSPSPWRADLPGTAIQGLRAGWQRDVASALGSYDDMVRRDVGEGSALGLRTGPNALWPQGLLLPAGPH